VRTGAASIAPGGPVSLGSLIRCLRDPGMVTIERVALVDATGGLTLDAFTVRPNPYGAGGEGGIGIGRDDQRGFGLDPAGKQVVDGTCPATEEDETWADTSELVLQMSYPASGSTGLGRADRGHVRLRPLRPKHARDPVRGRAVRSTLPGGDVGGVLMVREPIPRLFALVGDPVAGNPTQEVVEDAFRRLGLDWRYVTARVRSADLPAAIAGLRALGFAGAHVTVPHKVAVAALVDELSPAAAAIGAVNCLVARDGRLTGENTDGKGLVAAVSAVTSLRDASVVLFGAGGAARAIGVELALAGVRRLTVVNRDAPRRSAMEAALRAVLADVAVEAWPDWPRDVGDAWIVVNATTIGMTGGGSERDEIPIDWTTAPPGLVAADVVIAPETTFLHAAREAGAVTVSGVDMLVEQAALSVELWSGRTPDRAAIRALLERELAITEGVDG
jgi:shikimate dehydrogenase